MTSFTDTQAQRAGDQALKAIRKALPADSTPLDALVVLAALVAAIFAEHCTPEGRERQWPQWIAFARQCMDLHDQADSATRH